MAVDLKDEAESQRFTSQAKLLVGAIDFGTTYSGWAFSFKHQYEKDPSKIQCKQWVGGNKISLKAPTTVLIKPDGKTLEAFGYDAENRYAELYGEDEDENEDGEYYYFRRFKMSLFNKKLDRKVEIEDVKGRKLPAITVFAVAIDYLRGDLVKNCSSRLADGMSESDIQWVITVPAIWNDAAKQFMREAAVLGGIDTKNLMIALEPEAASLFCRMMPVQSDADAGVSAFQSGAKYMVVDAGGGTVDITVHEILEEKRLKELHKASGGDWGGTNIDKAFRNTLVKIFGESVLKRFQNENPEDYLDLFRDFEVKKRDIAPQNESEKDITFKLPTGLRDIFRDESKQDIKKHIEKPEFEGSMRIVGVDRLRIKPVVCREWYTETIEKIVNHMKELFTEQDCEAILMVGGFSESVMLQESIRSAFPDKKLITSEDAGLVVLKGAVVFGHNPITISERVCKYTYGLETNGIFKEGLHDEGRKFQSKSGKWYCKGAFDKHVEIGQTIKVGEIQAKRDYIPLGEEKSGYTFVFQVYASTKKKPVYVSDEGCTHLGKIRITDIQGKCVDVAFKFSGTEIEVIATDRESGKKVTTQVNFLG